MKSGKIHIARAGIELGVLDCDDAIELLRAGFLQPTDEFWSDENQQPRPVLELPVTENSANWLGRTKSSIAKIGGNVASHAVGAAAKVSSVARTKKAALSAVTDRLLEDYLPFLHEQVAATLQQTVGSAKSALQDEVFLRKLFGAVYDCLPKAVQRFVAEGAFVEFCLKHRRRLLDGNNPTAAPANL